MCGIVGGIGVEPFDCLDEADRLSRAVDCLAHRGPDDAGSLVWDDRRAFLGHRRLSIIDLEGGHEPIADESGRRHLSYNGEIYNYRALRQALLSRGHVFRTRTDGEVALHLYEEAPREFVADLQGMFAIAILDETDGRLTLVRDRNGIKPLYYYRDDRLLIFASEIKAILALLPARPPVSPRALRDYLRWKYVPAPLTIFENLYELPAGHMLRATPDPAAGRLAVEVDRYWELDYGGGKLTDEREAVELLDAKLRAAVESHLEADVEVGALLSGGVDSSLVVALAATVAGKRVKTFSVGFEEPGFDQLPAARTLARRYNTEHHEEYISVDPMTLVPKLVRHFDQPFADSSALACYGVCETASRHVKVALTGDGGDETFAGYRRYADLLTWLAHDGAWRRWLNRAAFAPGAAAFSPEAKFLKRCRAALHPPLERYAEMEVTCGRWLTGRLLTAPYQADGGQDDAFERHLQTALARGWSPFEAVQYADLNTYLPGDILRKVDRTSMACSLECRVPLLDHSITEFSARLSVDLKMRDGVGKYILKRVAERYVPRELLYGKKRGFRVPIRRWFKRGLLDRTAELLLDGVLVGRGILDPAGVRWAVRNQRRAWMNLSSCMWALLFLEHWARVYLDSLAPVSPPKHLTRSAH